MDKTVIAFALYLFAFAAAFAGPRVEAFRVFLAGAVADRRGLRGARHGVSDARPTR